MMGSLTETVTMYFLTFVLKIFNRMTSPVTVFYVSIFAVLSVTAGFTYDPHGRGFTDEISIKQGKLVGLKVEFKSSSHLRPVEVYLGIPYAAAPTGSQRFMPPGSPPPWKGVKFANKHPAVCPQNPPDINSERKKMTMSEGRAKYLSRLLPFLLQDQQDEDCLYLNIFAPAQKRGPYKSKSKYPVIVFIHGESFEWNSGNPYDGSVLASYGEVVVVTMNFRLGILGFLRPGVGDNTLTNFGLLDQIAALQWVKENIEHFGGDPKCVTLMGHGTGAACVNYLMVSPVSRGVGGSGLFHRAILMSGTALADWALTTSNVFTIQVAQALNCPFKATNNEMTECLQKRRLDEIMAVEVEALEFKTRFGPMVDGSVVPNDPFHVTGEYKDLFGRYELLYGVTELESYNLLDAVSLHYGMLEQDRDKKIRYYVQERFEYLPDMYLAETLKAYTDVTRRTSESSSQSIAENNRNTLLDILSDARVVAPMVQTANFHSSANPKSYFYVFSHRNTYGDYESASIGKSIHGEELPYVFGVPLVNGHFPKYPFSSPEQGFPSHPHFTDTERLLSEAIITFWTNFAKTGNPNVPLRPRTGSLHETDWPEYESNNQIFLSLGIPPVTSHHYRSKMTTFWNMYLPEADKNSGFQGDDGCPETNTTETRAEVGTTSSVAISIVVVVGLCLLLINLCACAGLYYQRDRLRAQERLMKRLYGDIAPPANNVDLYIKQKDNVRLGTKNVVVLEMAERRDGHKKKTAKQSVEQVYEAVRSAGHLALREQEDEDEGELSFKRWELSRQCSASTIDPHTKVREWIASADLNQQCLYPNKRNKNLNTHFATTVETTAECKEIQTGPKTLATSLPKPTVKKVSVAVDATPKTVTANIPKQVSTEPISKSMENLGKCVSTSKIVLKSNRPILKRSETYKDSLTKSSSPEHVQTLRRSVTSAELKANISPHPKKTINNLPIVHKHSKSDPVSQTKGSLQQNVSQDVKRHVDISLDPMNGSLIPTNKREKTLENSKAPILKKTETKTSDNKNDIGISQTNRTKQIILSSEDITRLDVDKVKKVDPLTDIKRKNYPRVLPVVPLKNLGKDSKEFQQEWELLRTIASQNTPSTSFPNDETQTQKHVRTQPRQKPVITSRKQSHTTSGEPSSSKNTSGVEDMKQHPISPVTAATPKSVEERPSDHIVKYTKQKTPTSGNPNSQRPELRKQNPLHCQQCARQEMSQTTLAKPHRSVPIQTSDASTETKPIEVSDLQQVSPKTKDSKQTSSTSVMASDLSPSKTGTVRRAKQKTDANLQTEEQIPETPQFREHEGCVVCETLYAHLNTK